MIRITIDVHLCNSVKETYSSIYTSLDLSKNITSSCENVLVLEILFLICLTMKIGQLGAGVLYHISGWCSLTSLYMYTVSAMGQCCSKYSALHGAHLSNSFLYGSVVADLDVLLALDLHVTNPRDKTT